MTQLIPSASQPLYRIGAVAQLAGIPVATLRVWERRYGVVKPPKSDGGHRLYTDADVMRVTLMKNLTLQGHAISNLSTLDTAQLQKLLNDARASRQGQPTRPVLPSVVNLVVVGYNMGGRIEKPAFNTSAGEVGFHVVNVFADLPEALQRSSGPTPDVLLLQIGALQMAAVEDLRKLQRKLGVHKVVLIYHFATAHVLNALKAIGVLYRQEPVTDEDLRDIIFSALLLEPSLALRNSMSLTIPPRQYDDLVLEKVAGISGNVLCECPKHVADLIRQLNSFEEYSKDCLSRSSEDASLHAYLSAVSGSARVLFEEALGRVALHEGIDLTSA
ncbi:MAG: MerR family transcriptional regulator [Betaproteobacteria bacterium]|nr:MerR family transcriptional regulator [Betaproteobacteria bacterium]